jgi:hypothetical protein
MGTPEKASNDEELARQFARTARLAVEAGAQIVEANLSCPNTGGELVCQSPQSSEMIVRKIASELRRSRTPLLIKISYLEPVVLDELMRRCGPLIQGIVAINTVSVPVVTVGGKDFFAGRPRAGLSGAAIRQLASETVRRLVDMRERNSASSDWVIVGMGGVTTPADYDTLMNVGADAVQSCSGAWLNPHLAIDIQVKNGVAPANSQASEGDLLALLMTLQTTGETDLVQAGTSAQLTPSAARDALETLQAQGWVRGSDRTLSLTRSGRRALLDARHRGMPVSRGSLSVKDDVDARLLEEISRLR